MTFKAKDLSAPTAKCFSTAPQSFFIKPKEQRYSFFLRLGPSWFQWLLIILALLVFPVYFSLNFERNISSPFLKIDSPVEYFETQDASIIISGSTSPEAEITLNDEKVVVQESGQFEKSIPLKEGLNDLLIKAQRFGRQTTTKRTVIYNKNL